MCIRDSLTRAAALVETLNDPLTLGTLHNSLGRVYRAHGRLDEALKLHREAVDLSISPDLKLRGLLDLALDYAAQPDYRKAISTCREALALPSKDQAFYKRYHAQLALGDFLLSQAKPTAADIAEAASSGTALSDSASAMSAAAGLAWLSRKSPSASCAW